VSAAVAEAPQRAQEEAPGAGAAMRAAAEAQQLRELEDKARFGRAAASPAMPATMHYLHSRVHACLPNAILLCLTVDELEWTCTLSPLVPERCMPACECMRCATVLHVLASCPPEGACCARAGRIPAGAAGDGHQRVAHGRGCAAVRTCQRRARPRAC
jgi:hypothetical protein